MLEGFPSDALRASVHGLGIETFVGSSGRVFPTDMKAAPLLRAWLHRLREAGVQFHMRHRWLGWNDDGALRFASPQGEIDVQADVTVLALGGGSWAQLGSDGAWVPLLRSCGVDVAPLRARQLRLRCGGGWSAASAQPLRRTAAENRGAALRRCFGLTHERKGELCCPTTASRAAWCMQLSAPLRDTIAAAGGGRSCSSTWRRQAPERVDCRSRPSARRAFALQPPAKPRRHQGCEGGAAARALIGEQLHDPVRLAARDKIAAD